MLPPSLLHRLGQLQRGRAVRAWRDALDDPAAAQTARLRQILRGGVNTAYGREHGFDPAWTARDYARNVPIITADELAPWVDRLMAGERRVLTQEDPVYYVRTTGTTGRPKHVPITPSYTREFQASLHVALWHLYREFPAAFRGKALYFVAPPQTGRADDGLPVGTMSGYNYSALPKIVRALYAWPPELFAVTDLRTRSFLALYGAVRQRITFAASIFPLTLVLLLRALQEQSEELAHHLEHGTLPAWLELNDRAPYQAWLRPNPRAAQRLRRAAKDPENAVAHALPDLKLVICWTGASAGLYLPELTRRLGPQVAVRDAVYSASEGWLNSPLGAPGAGGPVGISGHYVEWRTAEGGPTVGVQELTDNAVYEPILTTSAGLYRYALGDLVRVVGRHRGVPCIVFEQKRSASCNIAGEKLGEADVNAAVGPVLEAFGLSGAWFCVAPSPTDACYLLHVECIEVPQGLAAQIDSALARSNSDYADVRDEGSLSALIGVAVPPGTWTDRRQAQALAGVPVDQLKAKHLLAEPWT